MDPPTNERDARPRTGRPAKYDEPADTFSWFGPERVVELVDAEASRRGLTRSEMVVEILTEWAKARHDAPRASDWDAR